MKTLANYFLSKHSLTDPYILKVWCVFPTKRSSLFFQHYLKEKAINKGIETGIFPRIFSFEEFITNLYVLLSPEPYPQIPDILRIFIFLEALEIKKGKDFIFSNCEKNFFWGLKFLEVFEEFEKEGKIPENLIYPPEELPLQAKELFEEIKEIYSIYHSLLEKKKVSYHSYRLKNVASLLSIENSNYKTILEKIKEIWFIGFAGLRGTEAEILKFFKILSQEGIIKSFFIFSSNFEIPLILKNTLSQLGLEPEFLDASFYEKKIKEPKIYFYRISEPHTQIKQAIKLISEEKIESPDKIVIILPDSINLFPLLYALDDLKNIFHEINITLQYPLTKFPLNTLLTLVIKAQKEKNYQGYSSYDYLRILKHPYLRITELEIGISFEKIVQNIENFLRKKGYLRITPKEIETQIEEILAEKLSEQNRVQEFTEICKNFLKKIHQLFFKNWEDIKKPFQVSQNIKEVLLFLKPVLEEIEKKEDPDWQSILLRNYLYILENKIYPIFEDENYLNLEKFPKELLLDILEYLLRQEKVSFEGDPLKGLQIMGFLETRLLSFEKVIILDVNEGILPPASEFNPLLTDEIKTIFEIPTYKNELSDYYFDTLIHSAEENHLFYLLVEKGKTQEFKEPSRFIHKLKWELEKKQQKIEEKSESPDLIILQKIDGIPKNKEIKEALINFLGQKNIIRNEKEYISRYFFETYLSCGAKFYFKYILKLKESEKIGLESTDIGNFVHNFFENYFKPYLGKSFKFKSIYDEEKIKNEFESLWNEYEFYRKMDALSHFFSKKIALESINRYFKYLIEMENANKLKETQVLGIEKVLKTFLNFEINEKEKIILNLMGKIDYLIKRKEGITKFLILDYKSNPYTNTYPKLAQEILNFKLPERFDQYSIYEVALAFGDKLSNFQLMFYFYLFYKSDLFNALKKSCIEKSETYSINAGFITPSYFEKPEKFLFNVKLKDFPKIYNYFENKFPKLIKWILYHILESDKFYFTYNENFCKYCEYKEPCKNYKYFLK